MFGFSIGFGCQVTIFDNLANFLFLFIKNDLRYSLALLARDTFFLLIYLQARANIFSFSVLSNNACFLLVNLGCNSF